MAARAHFAASPLRLGDKLEVSPMKKKKSLSSDPQQAFASVMGKSTKEFAMPKTHALPALLDILGIHLDEACLIAACPISVIFVKLMTPFGFDSSVEALDVEKF